MASRKPQVLKTATVAKALAGESNAKIARDLGMNRNTVAAILEESELSHLVESAKSTLYGLLPKSVQNIDRALSAKKPDVDTAKWLLERTGVVQSDQVANSGGVTLNFVSHMERPNRGSDSNAGDRNLPALPETAGVSSQCS
jgi:hypothetical protein